MWSNYMSRSRVSISRAPYAQGCRAAELKPADGPSLFWSCDDTVESASPKSDFQSTRMYFTLILASFYLTNVALISDDVVSGIDHDEAAGSECALVLRRLINRGNLNVS